MSICNLDDNNNEFIKIMKKFIKLAKRNKWHWKW